MKKIIICLLLVLTFIFIFSGCSLTEFHKIHVIEANKCFEIKNLVISYGTCDVELKNGERLYLSQGNNPRIRLKKIVNIQIHLFMIAYGAFVLNKNNMYRD